MSTIQLNDNCFVRCELINIRTVRFAFSEVAPSPNVPSLNASVSSTLFLYQCRSVTLERRSLNANLTIFRPFALTERLLIVASGDLSLATLG